MFSSKVTLIFIGQLQMVGFCLVMEFHRKESATNRATPSNFEFNIKGPIFSPGKLSYIRNEKYRPPTNTTTPTTPNPPSRSWYPPWILKQGGLESSGRIGSS